MLRPAQHDVLEVFGVKSKHALKLHSTSYNHYWVRRLEVRIMGTGHQSL